MKIKWKALLQKKKLGRKATICSLTPKYGETLLRAQLFLVLVRLCSAARKRMLRSSDSIKELFLIIRNLDLGCFKVGSAALLSRNLGLSWLLPHGCKRAATAVLCPPQKHAK